MRTSGDGLAGPRPGPRLRPRPGGARPGPAGPGRDRGGPAPAPARRHADPDAHRPRRGRVARGGPGLGRRRLPGQAVRTSASCWRGCAPCCAAARLGAAPSWSIGDLMLNPDSHEVRRGERTVALTQREFELLEYLMRNERIVVSRQQLLDEVWGYDPFSITNTIEVFISNLRKKLEPVGSLASFTRSAARATFSAYRRLPLRWRLAGGLGGADDGHPARLRRDRRRAHHAPDPLGLQRARERRRRGPARPHHRRARALAPLLEPRPGHLRRGRAGRDPGADAGRRADLRDPAARPTWASPVARPPSGADTAWSRGSCPCLHWATR